MNVTVYIFGEFNAGYSQYPDDYSSAVFKKFSANAKSTTQIAIHRDGNLIYYGYIRKLEGAKYIGLCIVLNGLMLNRIDGLFSLFENVISKLVAKGILIHFDDTGKLSTSVNKLFLKLEDLEFLTEYLRVGVNILKQDIVPLPAVNYGTSKNSTKEFTIEDNLNEIIKSSHTNGYTYIYKSRGYNTAQLNSYISVLNKTNNEKKKLQESLDALKKEHAKTLKQKKQVKVVLALFAVLLFCCGSLLSLRGNLNMANDTINKQADSISTKTEEISNLNKEINRLVEENRIEKANREQAEGNLEELKTKIKNIQPFIIKGTAFDFITGHLTINYYGMVSRTDTIQVKAFDEKGVAYNGSFNIDIREGDNSAKLYLGGNFYGRLWYSFEILKGNVILGGGRH